jgi:hypothetical protein
MKLGRFIKVIEKWVFFKLLFANLTDSSGGKNHTLRYFNYSSKKVQKSIIPLKYFRVAPFVRLLEHQLLKHRLQKH